MLGPVKLRCLDRPVAVSLEQLVPADHFYRHLDAALNLSFVRDLVRERYAERGRPSIDPIVFCRLQLIMFFEGIRSERQLMATVPLNLAHRWYLGYHLDEPLPDHSSLTRIRDRLGLPFFERFFEKVVELCQEAGLIWGKELFFDGTPVQANAAMSSLRSHWAVAARTHLKALFADTAQGPAPWDLPAANEERPPTEAETPTPSGPSTTATAPPAEADVPQAEGVFAEAAPPPSTVGEPVPLPFNGTSEAQQQLAAKNQATWRLLDEHRRDPDQPSGSRGYHRISDDKASTTDPDATPMRRFPGDVPKLGYHDQYVVDGGKARIILQAFVTPADVMDNTPMLDLFHRVCFRWHLRPDHVVGDAKFGTIANIRQLEAEGVKAYLPMPELGRRTGLYPPEAFTYDAERDEYRCPQGQPLRFERIKHTEDVRVYKGDDVTCWKCPKRGECTDSWEGRRIYRSLFIEYIERVKGYYETPAYKKAMRKRQVWIEPLFGEAKQWHGLKKFRLRGLPKVNMEALRIAAGQNLKRWLTKTGWGRRHGPAGSLALDVEQREFASSSTCSSRRLLQCTFTSHRILPSFDFFNTLHPSTPLLRAHMSILRPFRRLTDYRRQ